MPPRRGARRAVRRDLRQSRSLPTPALSF
jgi:hypothetical protein